jgi:hypothetical protein
MHLRDAYSNGDLAVRQRRKHAADPAAAASAGPGSRRLASARGRARRGLAAFAVSSLLGLAGVVAGSTSAASAVQDPPPHPWLAASAVQDPEPSPWLAASAVQDPPPQPWLT